MIDALRERLDAAERGRAAYIARADEDSQHYDGKGECDTTVVKDKCWGCVARESEAEAETLRGKLERARGALEYQHNGERMSAIRALEAWYEYRDRIPARGAEEMMRKARPALRIVLDMVYGALAEIGAGE